VDQSGVDALRIAINPPAAYGRAMYTIIETEFFRAAVEKLLTEDELGLLAAYLAENAEAGDVIPGSGGCRKLRWAAQGVGKRGGARVIYVNYLADGEIVLLAIYAKTQVGNIPAHLLKKLKEHLDEA